jgi:L-galactose dehydrogenase
MLARILAATPIDSVLTYCRYNLLITDMDDVLTPVARQNGVGLINASALVMGILSEQGPAAWHPAPVALKEAAQRAVQFAQQCGMSLSNQALRFCFDHPIVSCTLVSMSTREHVISNTHALVIQSDPAFQQEIRQLFGEFLNYVWPSGKPENWDLSKSTNTQLETA